MPILPRLSSLWRNMLHRNRTEQELTDEIQSYLDLLIDEKIKQGFKPGEARREALIQLGGVEQVKESVREIRIGQSLEVMWQDLRYGLRTLVKQRRFTLIAVITLALGIGANTAIFSVVNAVLLRPLPYQDPERLIMIVETKLPQFPSFAVSPANFLDWKAQNTVFERLLAIRPTPFTLTGTGDAERLRGMKVSDGLCAMLGVPPQIGRDFRLEEDQPEHNNVVILSHGLWQRRFGGDPNVLNQAITLDGQRYTVIGVMPSSFDFVDRAAELWTPMAFTPEQAQNRGGHSLIAVGQLKPDIELEQARTEMSVIADRLATQYPEVNDGWSVKITPLLEFTVSRIRTALLILLGAVVFVLLIACANVANLLLARAADRQKELAIRTALGAGRWRIVRQLLTENLLLSMAGGALGLLFANWGMDLLLRLAPQELPRMNDVSIDGRVLVFTAAVTLLTGLVFGLIPALQASRPNLVETMKDGGRGSTEGGRRQLIRNSLVVLEVASALVLLVGAGLMIKSFSRLQQVDPGFNPDNGLAVALALPLSKYPEGNQQIAFYQRLIEKVETLPGVESVGAVSMVPLSDEDMVLAFNIQGQPPPAPGRMQSTNYYSVSAGYFKSMGIPLLRGRLFTERDTQDSPKVALINETMAKEMFSDEDPIGRRIAFDGREQNPTWFEIVGIVGDVKHYGLDRATTMQTYEPYTQQTLFYMTLIVRTAGDPLRLGPAIRSEVLKLDKEQPISRLSTLDQFVSTSTAQQQFSTLLFGIFAGVAIVLASIGIYGLLSYSVTQRTHEIGIRLALGAKTSDVMRMIIRQGLLLAGVGIVGGIFAALALAKLISSFSDLLFEVKPTDPTTFGMIAGVLLVVALLACYLPAHRATKVDPLVALRGE